MSRKLYYFDAKGYCEPIRYILHYGGLEFEDVRIKREDWPKQKEILSPPFGKIPMYTENNITLHQSAAIAKYVASQVGLVPTDRLQEIKADIVLHTFNDFADNLKTYFRESDETKKQELKKPIVEEHIPFYFSRFDKQLAENKGHFVGKLTWADIVFVAMIELTNEVFSIELQNNYTNVKALFDEVLNLKGIKEYVESRKN